MAYIDDIALAEAEASDTISKETDVPHVAGTTFEETYVPGTG